MAIELYETHTMLRAMELKPKRPTFLRDRYFPTTDKDIYVTKKVLVEYKDERERKMAPAVVPLKGGIPVKRDGYSTEYIVTPYIAPERPLSVNDLEEKQFGETLFSQKKPAEREAAILAGDLKDMDELINSREEWMAAQNLFENGYTMKQYADEYGGGKYEEFEVRFYDEEKNPAVFIPARPWDSKGEGFLDDIFAMAQMLKRRGLRAADLIIGNEVAAILMKNDFLLKLLDNRSLQLAHIEPKEVPAGATMMGKVNVLGVSIEFIIYAEEIVDENNEDKKLVPGGEVCLTAPGMGRTVYGAVTQLEKDGHNKTYMGRRVPQVITDTDKGIRTLRLKARPLTVPNYKNSAIKAKVLF